MSREQPGSDKPQGIVHKQAVELIERGADEIELVSGLKFGSLKIFDTQYADWHASYPLEPMVRAHLLKHLHGYTNTRLHDRLFRNPEEVEALGFEQLPARTTFGRTWHNRFSDELQGYITRVARRIIKSAHERGNPLGLRSLEAEDKHDASDRSKNRFIREKTWAVAEEMRELLFPTLDLQRPQEGTKYETEELLNFQCVMGLNQCAAEQGNEICIDRELLPDGGPDADTHLYYLKKLSPEDVQSIIDRSAGVMVREARKHLEFDRPVDIAIDMTYIAYYGQRDDRTNAGPERDRVVVQGAPPSKSYEWCYKFGTASIVGDNVKFTLAMRPDHKGKSTGELVRELFWAAREHVSINSVYADRGFYAADVVAALEEANVNYIIPAARTVRIKRELSRRSDRAVWVKPNHGMYGKTLGGPTNDRVTTTLVGVPSTKDPGKTVPFITNFDVDDEIDFDRRLTQRIINRYRRHWGIENSYKTIKDFLAYTTSKSFSVRLFHFGFAVLLYNMWLLVDFLLQVSFDEFEYRLKPRLKAKRFANLVQSIIGDYG